MCFTVVFFCAFLLGGSHGVNLSFPPGFKFGAATASYQIEGAWNVSDKGPSIWDTFTHDPTSGVADGDTGDVACDSYHLWERDIEIAAELSLHFYRFSMSWSRLLPSGLSTPVSKDGKDYYNKLIDGLLAKGIEPVITLYHWDLPQRLQDLGGWTNPLVIDWFADYADVAYSLYGDRIKTWITINEPIVICDAAYVNSFKLAPGIVDPDVGSYLCSKNILLAHAKAYRLYHEKYASKFGGQVSFTNHIFWYEGLTEDDAELGDLANEYSSARYMVPVFSKEGGWPTRLEKILSDKSKKEGYPRSRLPAFTEEEKEYVRGTYDFFAFNHYTSKMVRRAAPGEDLSGFPLFALPELGLKLVPKPEWEASGTSVWLHQYPEGIRKCLSWIKKQFGDVPIFITENGYATMGGGALEDNDRVKYYKTYLEQILLSIYEDEVNVIGYTAWSLIDNFEWMDGYRSKFGLYEVDFNDPLRMRTPRKSARFYAEVIRRHSLDVGYKYMNTEL